MKKKRGRKRGKNILRGLSGNHVDGVCEGVYACYVLVHIDSHIECLWSARLKHGAWSVVPCYSEVLLCNQWEIQSPADIESVVGIVPLLITQILADMTEEEAKAKGSTILSEFRKKWPQKTNHPRPRRNRQCIRIPQNRKATRQSTKPWKAKKQLKQTRRLSNTAILANAKNSNTALNATVSTITSPTSQRWSHINDCWDQNK